MGNAFRRQPGPALYDALASPVTDDLLEIGLAFAIGIIFFSFLLIIPGIRGWERFWATLRVSLALFIGAVILECNFGYEWYTAERCVRTAYKAYVFPAGIPQEIEADIGLHIGLRGINITLLEEPLSECLGVEEEDPEHPYWENRPFPGERIRYNDAYRWADPWRQGRLGFGRFAGRFNIEFREAQFRGVPLPITWISEYFTLDGELIRWGRKFRVAGWYAHIFLWTAFATYLLSILLFIFTVQAGAKFMIITGCLMILASFSYAIIIINDPKIAIPFANPFQGTFALEPEYGWSFYLCLVVGILVFGLGVLIMILDFFVPRKIAIVFHHSIVEEDEFFAVEEEEEGEGKPGLEEYGVATKGGRTRATRAGRSTTRRGLSRYRQTQRKPRSTIRRGGGSGSQRLHDDIQLEELPAKE